MAIKHHPDIPTLMTCAAGSQPETLCAVVSSHLSVCPTCFDKVARLSRIGVTLFERLEPVALRVAEPCGATGGAGLDRPAEQSWRTHGDGIPGPLTQVLGRSLDEISWEAVAPGVEQCEVELSAGAPGDLRLIRLQPNASFRWRTGAGETMVMVLSGRCSNASGEFEAGDVEEIEEASEHMFVAGAQSGCVLLKASESQPLLLDKVA